MIQVTIAYTYTTHANTPVQNCRECRQLLLTAIQAQPKSVCMDKFP